jgi:hypothetical protein
VSDEQQVNDAAVDTDPTSQSDKEEPQRPPDIPVEELLFFVLSELIHKAWINLGIQIDPSTGDTTENLPQARLAIDGASALLPVIEKHFGAESLRDVRNTIAGLQLNYVQRVEKAQAPTEEQPVPNKE